MSALGQKQTCAVQTGMSALPPEADIKAVRSKCPLRAADVDRRPSQDLGVLFARLYFGAPIDRPRTAQPVAADVSYRLSPPKRPRLQLYSP